MLKNLKFAMHKMSDVIDGEEEVIATSWQTSGGLLFTGPRAQPSSE
jgi:hypothetical protein